MAKHTMAIAALVMAAGLLGCGNETGYLIRPVPVADSLQETVVARDGGLFVADKVAIIDVDGLLMNVRGSGGLLGGYRDNPVSLFVEKLDRAEADPSVRAVVLRINSPGGAVTASDIMYQRLIRFRQNRSVPVVAIIEDVGASGAYYLACGADTILCHPTSVTGSIGVIVQTISFAGTMDMLGIDAAAITSGPRKDLASPLKPLDPADRAILQAMVDDFHGRFLRVVSAGRPSLADDQIAALATGEVFTGQQAVDNGLADGLGYLNDAIALAKSLAEIERVQVVMYHRAWGYRANVYSESSAPPTSLVNLDLSTFLQLAEPRFMYLWSGHVYDTGSPDGH